MAFEMQHRAAQFYARTVRQIMSMPANEWAVDAYAWDHDGGIVLSPIEAFVWSDIRECDMVMYPQWPVAGYFVDFGNPVAKVAIECDGKAFHDPERDAIRQRHIEAKGWSVYRFPGWLCARDSSEVIDAEGRVSVVGNECLEKVRAIGQTHGLIRHANGTSGPVHVFDVVSRVIQALGIES